MIQKSIIAVVCLCVAALGLATEDRVYTCVKENQTVIIRIEYQNITAPVPCKVTYQRGKSRKETAWSAQNQQGFCEEKAVAFVQRQSERGWVCRT